MKSISILRISILLVLLNLVACTEDPEPGLDGLVSLVKVAPETAGNNCPAGGYKIDTGVDKDRDTILDQNEIQNSVFICNGVNGVSGVSGVNGTNGTDGLISLIKVTNEPPGINCNDAGFKIETGLDSNGDGVLTATEVTNVFYICNGSLVNYGKQTIVLSGDITDEEAAKLISSDIGTATQEIRIVNCTHLTTVDLSKLETVIDIRIYNNEVLKSVNLSGLKRITGNFLIDRSPELMNLDLEQLTSIFPDEYFYIYDTKIKSLLFPSLEKIEGAFGSTVDAMVDFYDNDQLTVISMPLLKKTTATIRIMGDNLTAVNLPLLVTAGPLIIFSVSLTNLSLPELKEAESIHLFTSNLATLNLDHLAKARVGIYFEGNKLTSLSLPELTELGGSTNLSPGFPGYLHVSSPSLNNLYAPKIMKAAIDISNSALSSISLPAYQTGTLKIVGNNNLNEIILPLAPQVWDVEITGNQNLTSITLPLNLFQNAPYYIKAITLSQNKFPTNFINSILSNLVSLTPALSSYNIYLNQTIPAPPTGQGITDKNILITNGNFVQTD